MTPDSDELKRKRFTLSDEEKTRRLTDLRKRLDAATPATRARPRKAHPDSMPFTWRPLVAGGLLLLFLLSLMHGCAM